MNPHPLAHWLRRQGGVAHRTEALRAGFSVSVLRERARAGEVRVLRRHWLALPTAPRDLADAARLGGRLTCLSLARRRGWWMPESTPGGLHLHVRPGSASPPVRAGWDGRIHWSIPLAPVAPTDLRVAVEDALAHIAVCLPWDEALILWESACTQEKLSPEVLRGIPWTTVRARDLAHATTGLSDSGIETDLFALVRGWRVPVRQQVMLAGHPVDLLIGDWLVAQADGFEFHTQAKDRTRDIAHDAELRLRGFNVMRFSYHQIVRDRRAVADVLRRAIAQGLHTRPGRSTHGQR